jgi:sec-independent protein translocase protein TatB
MFGIGFTEILLIAIIAILFLGPDKLPESMVQIAKFFKSVKKSINEAKSSFEEEIRIADLKEEALEYKKQLESANSELQGFKHISMDEILDEPAAIEKKPVSETKASPDTAGQPAVREVQRGETVSFKKEKKPADTQENGDHA